jgi:hypothetical protein
MNDSTFDATIQPDKRDVPRWARLIKEAYGLYMDSDKARFWGEELRRQSPEGVGSISDDEIESAVRFLRVKASRDEKARAKNGFSLDTLIMAVRWMRKENAEREGRGVSQDQFKGTLEGYKDRMMREPYIEERWHILCSAPTRHCQDMDVWAEDQWGDEWRNTRTKLRREFAAGMRDVIAQIKWAC